MTDSSATEERLWYLLNTVYECGYTDRDKFYGYAPKTSEEIQQAFLEIKSWLEILGG